MATKKAATRQAATRADAAPTPDEPTADAPTTDEAVAAAVTTTDGTRRNRPEPGPNPVDTGKTVTLTSDKGTKVTVPEHLAGALKGQGYK